MTQERHTAAAPRLPLRAHSRTGSPDRKPEFGNVDDAAAGGFHRPARFADDANPDARGEDP